MLKDDIEKEIKINNRKYSNYFNKLENIKKKYKNFL
jgi:hypothetical protein